MRFCNKAAEGQTKTGALRLICLKGKEDILLKFRRDCRTIVGDGQRKIVVPGSK